MIPYLIGLGALAAASFFASSCMPEEREGKAGDKSPNYDLAQLTISPDNKIYSCDHPSIDILLQQVQNPYGSPDELHAKLYYPDGTDEEIDGDTDQRCDYDPENAEFLECKIPHAVPLNFDGDYKVSAQIWWKDYNNENYPGENHPISKSDTITVTRGSRNWPTGLKISAPVETNPDIDVNNLFTGETINLSADAEKAFPKGTVFTWTLTRDDKPISLPRPKGQKLTYTFTEPGKYFFSVSAVNAKGAVCGELKTYVPYVLDVKKPSTYRGTPAVTISDNLKNSYTLGQKVDGAITCSSDIPATFTLTILREGKKLKTYKDFSALNGFRFSQLGDYVFKCEATDINDDNIKGYAQRSVGVFKADICENNETLDYPNAVRDKDSVVRGSAETVVFTASGVHDDCYKAVTVDTTQLDQILLPDYTVKYDPAKMTLTVTGTLRDANNIPNQVELPYYDGNGALSGYVRVYTPAQTEPRVITPKVAPHNGESFTLSLSPDVPGATAKMEITDVAGIQVAGISGFSGNLTLPSGTYIIKSTITPANDVPYTLADVYLDIYDSPPEIQTFSYDPSSCTRDPNYATTTSPVCPQNVKFSLIAQAQYSLSLSTITVNFGDGTSTTFAANPLTKAYEFTHEYRGDKGQATYNIVISVTDSAGQTTTMGKDGRWSFRVN